MVLFISQTQALVMTILTPWPILSERHPEHAVGHQDLLEASSQFPNSTLSQGL